MSIGKAFSIYYGLEMSNEVKSNRAINQIVTIEIGKIYLGTVKEFNERFNSEIKDIKRVVFYGKKVEEEKIEGLEIAPTRIFPEAPYDKLKEEKIDLIVLAGYLAIISPELVTLYKNKIINN